MRQQPAFMPVESLAHAERVVATVDQRRKSRPEGELIDRVVSLNQFIPERQTEKINVLRRLQETLADVSVGATAAAFAYTVLGFGALAFSGHPGLASLVGFAAILLVSLLARVIVP